MKKIIYILIVQILITNYANASFADTIKTKNNSVFIELGGKGLAYTINYERQFCVIHRLKAAIGVGVSYFHINSGIFNDDFGSITPEIDLIYGSLHNIEVGYSKGFYFFNLSDENIQSLKIGYRYQKPDGGFLFRANFCPLYWNNDIKDIYPWLGISFGYVF
jgi:hypothetical protein